VNVLPTSINLRYTESHKQNDLSK